MEGEGQGRGEGEGGRPLQQRPPTSGALTHHRKSGKLVRDFLTSLAMRCFVNLNLM